jgi:hypothetical protein
MIVACLPFYYGYDRYPVKAKRGLPMSTEKQTAIVSVDFLCNLHQSLRGATEALGAVNSNLRSLAVRPSLKGTAVGDDLGNIIFCLQEIALALPQVDVSVVAAIKAAGHPELVHEHKTYTASTQSYIRCASPQHCDVTAHCGRTIVETCKCGAQRLSNVCVENVEIGEWSTDV